MQISHYEVGELIGQGGMGRVFKATDTRVDRAVAVKIIDHSPTTDHWESDFLQEAKVLARLQHPNIVTLFDVGVVDGRPFLVTEYLEGHSLQSLLEDQVELPFRQVLDIGAQICNALEHAHSQGIIHRDIKPGNILRLKNNTVKVLDFGLSITGRSSLLPPTARTEDLCGTFRYMSPEQLQGFAVNRQTDIYSTGLVLHELLANHSVSTDAITVDGNPSVVATGGYIPVALGDEHCNEIDNILCNALAQDPLLRYMRAEPFGHALLNLKQRVERREITALYERGCALVNQGDLQSHAHEITQVLIELDQIDPACEERRMLMDQAMAGNFRSRLAEVLRLTEEGKFGEAERVLKTLYMLCGRAEAAKLDLLASSIRARARKTAAIEKEGNLSELRESSGISDRLGAKLRFFLRKFSGMPNN